MVPTSRAGCAFLAGVAAGSSACSLLVSTSGLSSGDASAPSADGVLYDTRVYNRALTASEVAALYDRTACP